MVRIENGSIEDSTTCRGLVRSIHRFRVYSLDSQMGKLNVLRVRRVGGCFGQGLNPISSAISGFGIVIVFYMSKAQ
jgi:hypothetical protein